jgi:hypothetical protein
MLLILIKLIFYFQNYYAFFIGPMIEIAEKFYNWMHFGLVLGEEQCQSPFTEARIGCGPDVRAISLPASFPSPAHRAELQRLPSNANEPQKLNRTKLVLVAWSRWEFLPCTSSLRFLTLHISSAILKFRTLCWNSSPWSCAAPSVFHT